MSPGLPASAPAIPSGAAAPSPLDVFCRPLPLAAVGVLVVNDHLLKGSGLLPAAVTGKLSDFAGLFFFPLFLAALLSTLRKPADAELLVAGCAVATGAVFCAIKVSPEASDLYAAALGALRGAGRVTNACDPTDLIALPMLALSLLYACGGIRPVPARAPRGVTR